MELSGLLWISLSTVISCGICGLGHGSGCLLLSILNWNCSMVWKMMWKMSKEQNATSLSVNMLSCFFISQRKIYKFNLIGLKIYKLFLCDIQWNQIGLLPHRIKRRRCKIMWRGTKEGKAVNWGQMYSLFHIDLCLFGCLIFRELPPPGPHMVIPQISTGISSNPWPLKQGACQYYNVLWLTVTGISCL